MEMAQQVVPEWLKEVAQGGGIGTSYGFGDAAPSTDAGGDGG